MQKKILLNKFIVIVLLFTFFLNVSKLEAISETVIISAEVVASVTPVIPPSTNGGITNGGSSILNLPTIINFYGTARPNADVYIIKDGQMAIITKAGPDAKFKASLDLPTTNTYYFSIHAIDFIKGRSLSVNLPIYILKGTTVDARNIFLNFRDDAIEQVGSGCPKLIGDLNCDNHVNLLDFSILSFWYNNQAIPPKKVDIDLDGKITLIDFSIMMYYWTD